MFTITDINEFRRESKVKSRAHAMANAAQSALSTEEDRAALRRRRLEVLQLIEQKRGEIFDLETEYDMLGGGSRG
jgi:hypothetical protein